MKKLTNIICNLGLAVFCVLQPPCLDKPLSITNYNNRTDFDLYMLE